MDKITRLETRFRKTFIGDQRTPYFCDLTSKLIKFSASWTLVVQHHRFQLKISPQIKAKALADFIQEITRKVEQNEWEVYVDGSSTQQGAGAGIILIIPEKDELEFAIRFQFKASNNDAEYEALLQGLKLAEHAGAKNVK